MSPELQAIETMPVSELAAQTGSELCQLMKEVRDLQERMRVLSEWLHSAIAYKYVYKAAQIRFQSQQEYGEVCFDDGGVEVRVDVPRNIDWDQDKLTVIADRLRDQGADPAEFLEIHYSVSQEKFDGWPDVIRRSFEPALQVKGARSTYTLVGGES